MIIYHKQFNQLNQSLSNLFNLPYSEISLTEQQLKWANVPVKRHLGCPPMKGELNGMYGKKHTPETLAKMRGSHSISEANKLKMAEARRNSPNKSRPLSEETKQKMRKSKSIIHKQAMALAASLKPKLTCPHCGQMADAGNAKRWHFTKCKLIQ